MTAAAVIYAKDLERLVAFYAALGLEVDIRSGRGEKGELRIRYTSLDQLEDVRHRLLRRPAYR